MNPSILFFRKTDTASLVTLDTVLNSITTPETVNSTPVVTPLASTYFISAGSFYSDAEVEIVLAKLQAKGYTGYLKNWGKYKVAAVDIPEQTAPSAFRAAFVEATGIADAWVARNK